MGLFALVYLLPNVDSIGGFWLVFGAGTAIAAWVNFGTPRLSYGGYQVGLAFYKAILQNFGPVVTTKVIRDRLIGVFFGLTVFGIVERMLWPVRATDALRARLAEIMHLLADLVRAGAVTSDVVDSWRRRIDEKVQKAQELIETSKFDPGIAAAVDILKKNEEIQKLAGDVQIIFILLLSLARDKQDVTHPNVREADELDNAITAVLLALETYIAGGFQPAVPSLEGIMDAFQRYVAMSTDASSETVAIPHFTERLALYRALVTAIRRFCSELLDIRQEAEEHKAEHEVRSVSVQ